MSAVMNPQAHRGCHTPVLPWWVRSTLLATLRARESGSHFAVAIQTSYLKTATPCTVSSVYREYNSTVAG